MTLLSAPKMLLLLLKSAPLFAHTGKYALYGNPPRWHLVHHDKPAPKGAPIAAVPHAAGQHLPATLTPEQVDQLKYPAEKAAKNHEMAAFNEKHLPEMLAHAANGDATAILGMGFGTNSHAKKKATVANFLLQQMGSQHKVSHGQAAGSHPAVQVAEQDSQPAEVATAAQEQETTKPDANPEDTAPEHAGQALTMPAFQEGKTVSGVVAYYEPIAQKVMDLAAAGDVAGLEKFKADGLKPNSKGKVSNTWAGKTPNSKLLLALHAQALEHANGGKPAAATTSADLPGAETATEPAASTGQAQPIPVADKKDGAIQAAVDHLKEDAKQGDLPAAEKKEDAALVQKLEAAQGKPHELDLSDYKTGAWAPTLSAKAFKGDNPAWYSQQSGADIQVHGTMTFEGQGPGEHAKKTMAEYKAAKAAGYSLQNFKTSGLQHAYVFVKDGKILTKEGMAALVAGSPAQPAQEPSAVAGAPKGGNLSQKYWLSDKGPAKFQAASKTFGVFSADGKKALGKNGQPSSWGALYTVKEIAPHADKLVADGTHEWVDVYGSLEEANAAHQASAPAKKEPRLVLPKKAPDQNPIKNAEPAAAMVSAAPALSDGKLDQIPWDAQLLPAENKNAKSHNKQVEKIKAMALAGDVAGLEALKFGTNTYGKKQELLKQTALAALKESTQEAAEPAPAAPKSLAGKPAYDHIAQEIKAGGFADAAAKEWIAANPGQESELSEALVAQGYDHIAADMDLPLPDDTGPKEGDTKQGADGMLVFHGGRWHKQDYLSAADEFNLITWLNNGMPDKGAGKAMAGLWSDLTTDQKASLQAKASAKSAQNKAEISGQEQPATVKKLSASEVIAIGKGFKTAAGNKAKIKAFAVAGDMEGLKQFADSLSGKMPVSKKLAEKVLEAMEAAPEVPAAKPKKASKPKAAAAPQSAPAPAAPALESMDNWTQTGPQGGSNPGGRFKDASGVEWYCKFPADEDTAKAEVLAAKLYAALGISGQDAKLITKGGKVGIASKWTAVSKAISPAALAKVDGVAAGFGADAWLGNWDVVGLGYDNLQIGADGKAHRVDAGGSLMYRAQGGKKAFGNIVTEIDSLRDPKINPQAAKVFGGMTEADITASVAKVLAISDFTISSLVHKYGPGSAADKQKLIETLVARKADLAAKFPAAAKKKTPKFKPEEISAPPDFMNWGGSGKSGPSSKPFLNEANHKAAKSIFEAAKTGDTKAVNALTAPIYNKDTGEVVGSAPVLEHPSQHIKGYAQQVINEINYQLNPPKKFRFDGGHPLHALNNAYPAYKGSLQAQNVAKVAKFINLGEPGQITLETLGLQKKTYQSGSLTKQTYAKQAQAAIAKMPLTQKQAVKAYTGSSYQSINGSLWAGNPSGQATAAAQALHTLAHDIEPGTILSRKISLSGSDLQQLLNSKGKVLQEPAIMSTSIRPSCWSGNVHLKLHVGPGVKGLWAGYGSMPGGGALSNHAGEDEMILPPNTRIMIISVKSGGSGDADGFGAGSSHVVEAVILPSEGH